MLYGAKEGHITIQRKDKEGEFVNVEIPFNYDKWKNYLKFECKRCDDCKKELGEEDENSPE